MTTETADLKKALASSLSITRMQSKLVDRLVGIIEQREVARDAAITELNQTVQLVLGHDLHTRLLKLEERKTKWDGVKEAGLWLPRVLMWLSVAVMAIILMGEKGIKLPL